MLSPRRINNIDFSTLRENPDNLFILRFLDINEETRRTLATRIKETAPQYSIKKPNGPNIQSLYETLTEINPIIFSEYQPEIQRNQWYPRNSYKNFNFFNAHYISGYKFHNLCKAVYYTLCLKKPLTREKLLIIGLTINSNWSKVQTLIDRNLPQQTNQNQSSQNQETNTSDNNIGLEDIERVRRHVETNGANNIPEGMRENTPQKPRLRIPDRYRIDLNLEPFLVDEVDQMDRPEESILSRLAKTQLTSEAEESFRRTFGPDTN